MSPVPNPVPAFRVAAPLLATGLLTALLTACGGDQTSAEPACDLSLDGLAGRTFLMHEAQPDGSYQDNPTARMRFARDGDALKVQYTVGSLSDVYTFDCTRQTRGDKDELYCAEQERPRDWCQALEVHEAGSCTKKQLRALGISHASDDELNEAIKEAKATVNQYRGTDKWNHFVLNNNNLANKLQGRLYIEVDARRCRLSVTDMYFTIFDGRGIEDTNPVGRNPFVESKEDFLFAHCTDGRGLLDLDSAELPQDLSSVPPQRQHATGSEVFYHYLGETAAQPEDGCSYRYDAFAQWKPVAQGVAVEPADVKLTWSVSHTFAAGDPITYNGQSVGVFHMIRYKECGGEQEQIDVLCNAALVR